MKDTDYAFCVARLRANETKLLTNEFIEKLIEARSFDEAVNLLIEKGWIEQSEAYSDAINRHSVELWRLLNECVPDKKLLESLCVLNDYFNIKTAVKCAVTGEDASSFYVHPTTLNVEKLVECVRKKSSVGISDEHIQCANNAYDLAIKTENGQNVDITVDRIALEVLLKYGKDSVNVIFSKICNFIVDTSNVKIAIRCATTKKSKDFINASISGCYKLDRDMLVKLSSGDIDELYNYLLNSEYKTGVVLYKENPAAFDKWCDDNIIEIIKDSKYVAFGFAPVCAYYYAQLTEIKNIRILLTSKLSGVKNDVIRERVRNLYV